MLPFYEKDALYRKISVLFAHARKRHLTAADTEHWSISAFAPFSGPLLCNRMACALLPPLPTKQGLLAERFPQPYKAVNAGEVVTVLLQPRRHSFPQS